MCGWLSDASTRASRSKRASRLGIVLKRARENLDRDVALEPGVARAIDLAHPADAQQSVHLKDADAPPGEPRTRRRNETCRDFEGRGGEQPCR